MRSTSHNLLNYLRVVVGALRDDPRDDATLLARFTESGDEVAFRVLIWRHGPLVWQTCRGILGDTPDAEDTFQTTFLILARKAGRLRREPLAGWLHRVARRAALNADAGARRRRNLEHQLRAVTQSAAEGDVDRTELYTALDEELAGLPERLRVPLLLHYLEGKSQDEVAHFLGCSRGAVRKRLARGEVILRERLERRGLTVAVGVLLGSMATASAVPAQLIGSTARAAVAFRSGILTSGAAEAARAVLGTLPSSLGTTIMRKSLWIVLACSLGLSGAALITCQALSARPDGPGEAGPAATQTPDQPEPGDKAAARVDCYGDPLPPHALARMGTVRLWRGGERVLPKALAFSPDGKTLATHIDGMTVYLWDAATGKEICRLTTKVIQGHIASLGFSRDGKTLVTVNHDRTVCRWEVATGKFLRKQEYQGPKRENVLSLTVAFLPDGQMLGFGDFAAQEGRGMYVWNVATGKEICQLGEPRKRDLITATAFSPDGKLLAVIGDRKDRKIHTDGNKTLVKTIIRLWDVATGKEIRQLIHEGEQQSGGVRAVAFSRDGKTLASGDSQQICVLEVATGKKIHLLKLKEGMGFRGPLTYSPDNKTLLGGRAGQFWDVGTGKEIHSFGCINAMVALFSPDGKVLAMGDEVGAIRLWEATTGKEIGPRKGCRGRIWSVAYSPDGKTLASMGGDETVRLWEVATGKEMRPLAKHARCGSRSIVYSPDGKMLVSMDEVLHLWDTATGKEIRQFKGGFPNTLDCPRSAAFSPDGKKLAARVSKDEKVLVWEIATGKKIYELPTGCADAGAFAPVSLAFSPDGRVLAVPGNDNTVYLWETATGKRIGQLGEQNGAARDETRFVVSLAFSPDSRLLATSSSGDEKIHVWEVASSKESGGQTWQLDGLKNNQDGYTLTFSPDSRILAIAAQGDNPINGYFDPTVHLWEVASGKEIGQLAGHQSFVRTLAFSPDGKTLASGSDDLTCLIWDLTSFMGRLLKPVQTRPLSPQTLSKEQLEAAWADLAQEPAKAYAAIGTLQAVPTQAIALLRARVRPVASLTDPQQLKRWIADLDDNRFTVRDKVQQEIEKLGEAAIPALRQALKSQPPLEMKRRLQALLAGLEPKGVVVSPHHLREFRTVQVLEFIGTAEARQLLQAWAKGVAEARLTREAQAALARLAKRPAARF